MQEAAEGPVPPTPYSLLPDKIPLLRFSFFPQFHLSNLAAASSFCVAAPACECSPCFFYSCSYSLSKISIFHAAARTSFKQLTAPSEPLKLSPARGWDPESSRDLRGLTRSVPVCSLSHFLVTFATKSAPVTLPP